MTLSERIRSEIEERIRSGEWRPGMRIPFEHELVARYACSRATVSKALEALARAGLIERRRRAGSFVAKPAAQSAVLAVPDLAQVIADRGGVHRWRPDRVRPARGGETASLAAPALLVTGVHDEGDAPFALEWRLISLTAVPDAAAEPFAEVAPGNWLLAHVGWTGARHRIRAVAADRAVARALSIAAGTACLQVERWTWQLDEPITYVRQTFPGDRYDLVASFTPGDRPAGRMPSSY
ncbi:UTRA domain-containing protein [Sphingomonas bacterium]|uniref:UTRA domain-containing protein n=1 Tax=Sphingomonas bacterium TaxID=1895847 RepID=UPI0015764718|nr:UTRA domain-containing protein [Sphingomonas bacterium]